uniref:Uncharacterized protein n=1 Tax=Rhizophora mucronata TaxID=61149 RepID=A0A2P2PMP5_RHIMU
MAQKVKPDHSRIGTTKDSPSTYLQSALHVLSNKYPVSHSFLSRMATNSSMHSHVCYTHFFYTLFLDSPTLNMPNYC